MSPTRVTDPSSHSLRTSGSWADKSTKSLRSFVLPVRSIIAKLGLSRTVGLRVSSGLSELELALARVGSMITGGIDSEGTGGSKNDDDDLLRWLWGFVELMAVRG